MKSTISVFARASRFATCAALLCMPVLASASNSENPYLTDVPAKVLSQIRFDVQTSDQSFNYEQLLDHPENHTEDCQAWTGEKNRHIACGLVFNGTVKDALALATRSLGWMMWPDGTAGGEACLMREWEPWMQPGADGGSHTIAMVCERHRSLRPVIAAVLAKRLVENAAAPTDLSARHHHQ
jgi:hypothetical protein